MKKKAESKFINEPCLIMNISNNLNIAEGSKKTSKISESNEILGLGHQNHLTKSPPTINSINFKIKTENDECLNEDKLSPPLTSLGPGAEIKGKICHPIPSGSRNENSESPDDNCKAVPAGVSGGRLTFFKEGKLLLELSHRNDQGGAWVQVKSKTYWPPSSTATTTSTQHPLRHDTPTTQSASDDCSSMNSSPWFSDHVRKQVGPKSKNKVIYSSELLFYLRRSQYVDYIRRKVQFRRNPFLKIKGPTTFDLSLLENVSHRLSLQHKDIKFTDRSKRLVKIIEVLGEKSSYKLEKNVTIYSIFEKVETPCNDCLDPTFVSPRKRYLRSLESDVDSHIRKKVHSTLNYSVSNFKHCDRPSSSSPSFSTPHKSAINSQNSSSPYSIDSLLSSDNDKKNESFLRTLLKPEVKHRSPHHKSNSTREGPPNNIKYERGNTSYEKERKDSEHKNYSLVDHFDMSADLGRFSAPNLSGLYLNPYFDPRYMMLQSLSAAPSFLPPVSQSNDMAVAVAAAAAAGYPFTPLHMSALTSGTLMSPGALCSPYPPPTSIQSQLLRSPTPARSSPLSIPHSPSPKPSHLPLSNHLGRMSSSPRESMWSPPSHSNSSQKIISSSSVPQPPQDAPLNLSKPKGKS